MPALRVVVEVAPKRAFASAMEWPGWSRGAKTEGEAIDALLAYAPRYAEVARRAGATVRTTADVDVVERLRGGSGTEFGVPSHAATIESEPIRTADLERLTALLRAAWSAFDDAAASVGRRTLRLGPRGGGRQVPKMTDHVRDAEEAYLRQLGVRPPGHAMAEIREAFVAALATLATGGEIENPTRVKRPWPPRYAIRRSAWHALDHAWEIEDRLA